MHKKTRLERPTPDSIRRSQKTITNITENKHFDINKEERVKCDASKKRLGACLEQKHNSISKLVVYACRILNKLGERYSTNELEPLATVWALEHFKYYLYGNRLILQTDYQALLSALKNNRGNNLYQSRISRLVYRLLPINSTIEHIPRKNMRLAGYLSKNPFGKPTPENEVDKKFVVNTLQEIKHVWLNHNIEPTGKLKPTGKSTHSNDSTQNEQNDVTRTKQKHSHTTLTKQHSFCFNSFNNKLPRVI